MALLFSKLVGRCGKVVSFGPVQMSFAFLRKNFDLNHLTNIECFEAAVCSVAGTRKFQFEEARRTQGAIIDSLVSDVNSINVNCMTSDDAIDKLQIAPVLLKIDVEECGLGVLEGSKALIKKNLPRIYFEMHSSTIDCPEFGALRRFRDEFDYELFDLRLNSVVQLSPGWGVPICCVPRIAKRVGC